MKKLSTLRYELAQEAARLMYEEGVSQYFNAKRMAAKRLLGKGVGKRLNYRPRDLPSNGEIQAALKRHIEFHEAERHFDRLFAMRIVAVETMEKLPDFRPRLIGSVSTGHVRDGSDIDLHVFTDDIEKLFVHLAALHWRFEHEEVAIYKGGKVQYFTHVYLFNHFPIELSVYGEYDIRAMQRSSTDGKPIKRMKLKAVYQLLEQEHPVLWSNYQQTGVIEGLVLPTNPPT